MTESLTHSKTSLYTFLTLLFIFLILNAKMTAPYLLAVLMGGILALLFNPLYRRLRTHHFKRKVSAALVTLTVIVLILGPLISFISIALNEAVTLAQYLARNGNFSFDFFLNRLSRWEAVQRVLGGNLAAVQQQVWSAVQGFGQSAANSILALAGSMPEKLLKLILTLITCYFFLVDGKRFLTWLSLRLPLDTDVRARLFGAFKETAISVIWANMAAASAQAALMVLGYFILGVPGAFLAGVATFIFAWVPILGSFPVWIIGAGYLYFQASPVKAICMLLIGGVTSVADNWIRPWVLKGREDMHPLVSLIAVFGGISMFGIFGVFFGPIIAAALIALLQIWPVVGRRFGLTFEPQETEMPSPVPPPSQIQFG